MKILISLFCLTFFSLIQPYKSMAIPVVFDFSFEVKHLILFRVDPIQQQNIDPRYSLGLNIGDIVAGSFTIETDGNYVDVAPADDQIRFENVITEFHIDTFPQLAETLPGTGLIDEYFDTNDGFDYFFASFCRGVDGINPFTVIVKFATFEEFILPDNTIDYAKIIYYDSEYYGLDDVDIHYTWNDGDNTTADPQLLIQGGISSISATPIEPVPEPTTMLLLCSGLMVLCFFRKKHK